MRTALLQIAALFDPWMLAESKHGACVIRWDLVLEFQSFDALRRPLDGQIGTVSRQAHAHGALLIRCEITLRDLDSFALRLPKLSLDEELALDFFCHITSRLKGKSRCRKSLELVQRLFFCITSS